jgi:hypothetical protein
LGSIAPRLSTCDSDLDIDPDAPSMPTDNLATDMLHFWRIEPYQRAVFSIKIRQNAKKLM